MRHRRRPLVSLALLWTVLSGCPTWSQPDGGNTADEQLQSALKLMRQDNLQQAEKRFLRLLAEQQNQHPGNDDDRRKLLELTSQAKLCLGDIAKQKPDRPLAFAYYTQSLQEQELLYGADSCRLIPVLEKLVSGDENNQTKAQRAILQARLVQLKMRATTASNRSLFATLANYVAEHPDDATTCRQVVDAIAEHPNCLADSQSVRTVLSHLTRQADRARLLKELQRIAHTRPRLNKHSLTRIIPAMASMHYAFTALGDTASAEAMAIRLTQALFDTPASTKQKLNQLTWEVRHFSHPQSLPTTLVLIELTLKLHKRAGTKPDNDTLVTLITGLDIAMPAGSPTTIASQRARHSLVHLLPEELAGAEPSQLDLVNAYFACARNRLKDLEPIKAKMHVLAASKGPASADSIAGWCDLATNFSEHLNDLHHAQLCNEKILALKPGDPGTTAKQALRAALDFQFFRAVISTTQAYLRNDKPDAATRFLLRVCHFLDHEPAADDAYALKLRILSGLAVTAAVATDARALGSSFAAQEKIYRAHPELKGDKHEAFLAPLPPLPLPSQRYKSFPSIQACLSGVINQNHYEPAAVVEPLLFLAQIGAARADRSTIIIPDEKLYAQAVAIRRQIANETFKPYLRQIEKDHCLLLLYSGQHLQSEHLCLKLLAKPNGPDFSASDRIWLLGRLIPAYFYQTKYKEALSWAREMERYSRIQVPEDKHGMLEAMYQQCCILRTVKDWAAAEREYARTLAFVRAVPALKQDWVWNFIKQDYAKYCQERPKAKQTTDTDKHGS